jgi:hypothetical protein
VKLRWLWKPFSRRIATAATERQGMGALRRC